MGTSHLHLRVERAPGGTPGVEMSGTGPRSGPAGATAPARRKARKPSERSERPALEGNEQSLRARRLREMKKRDRAAQRPGRRDRAGAPIGA